MWVFVLGQQLKASLQSFNVYCQRLGHEVSLSSVCAIELSLQLVAGCLWHEEDSEGIGSTPPSSSHSSCHILLAGGSVPMRRAVASTLLRILEMDRENKCATLSLPLLVLEGDGDAVHGLLKALPAVLQR